MRCMLVNMSSDHYRHFARGGASSRTDIGVRVTGESQHAGLAFLPWHVPERMPPRV
jgi:hypothetical protein